MVLSALQPERHFERLADLRFGETTKSGLAKGRHDYGVLSFDPQRRWSNRAGTRARSSCFEELTNDLP